jgi:hypothetical protein
MQRLIITIALISFFVAVPADCAERNTANVILVTLDGVRSEDIFGGLDAALAEHSAKQLYTDIEAVHARFWRETAAERRQVLMPFFWNTLVANGQIYGDATHGSRMQVTNAIKWSTPGYTEILTGAAQPEVIDNTFVRYPHQTFLEYIRDTLKLKENKIAQFGSWDGFKFAAASRDDAFVMTGAYDDVPAAYSTPYMDEVAVLRRQVMGLWEEGSNDVLSYRLARAYLAKHEPKVMWLALGQSDDWAHADRYDRLLDYLHLADGLLEDLWRTLQENPAYAGKTTLIVTTDHGRGKTPADWMEHEDNIPGSENIWLAVIGPDTPPLGIGVAPGTVYQHGIAATVLALLGLDADDFNPQAGAPITGILPGSDE